MNASPPTNKEPVGDDHGLSRKEKRLTTAIIPNVPGLGQPSRHSRFPRAFRDPQGAQGRLNRVAVRDAAVGALTMLAGERGTSASAQSFRHDPNAEMAP